MKETFTISRYISLWDIGKDGHKGELLLAKAQIHRKIGIGKQLIVKTVEPTPKEMNLGIVEAGKNYTKGQCVDIRTDKGWFHVAYNESLTILLSDAVCALPLLTQILLRELCSKKNDRTIASSWVMPSFSEI